MIQVKEKSKVYLEGLEQGIRLQKEKQLERIRKILYMIVFNLSEEEIGILGRAILEFNTDTSEEVKKSG